MKPGFFGPAARRDLRQALRWIAQENEAAAEALLQAALYSGRRIAEQPMLGRLRLDLLPSPYRFWRVAGFPYLIVYDAARQPPQVLRMLHMARDLASLLADLPGAADEAGPE